VKAAQAVLAGLDMEQKELEQEQAFVVRASARFAHFLQNNGILAVNDGVEDYITFQIQEQDDIIAEGRRKGVDLKVNLGLKEGLKSQLDFFSQEKKILMEQLTKANKEDGGGVSAAEVHTQMQKIMALPHLGSFFKQARKAHQDAEKITRSSFQEQRVRTANKKGGWWKCW